jgi:RNA polymerase sigma-70 factor (ECF subfamily)
MDHFAWVLMNVHAPPLRKYVTRLMAGDADRSEDIVQETMLRAWQHREVIVAQASARPWLFRVARNLSVDWYRRQAARPTEVPDEAAGDDADVFAMDRLEDVVRRQLITDLLKPLSDQHREVLIQLYYFDRTQAEVAEVLGVAEGTVKSRAHYALSEIRQHDLRAKLDVQSLRAIPGQASAAG